MASEPLVLSTDTVWKTVYMSRPKSRVFTKYTLIIIILQSNQGSIRRPWSVYVVSCFFQVQGPFLYLDDGNKEFFIILQRRTTDE